MSKSSNKYFASLPMEELAPDLMKKADDYYEFLISSGLINLWRRTYNAYYRPMQTVGLTRAGQQGELTKLCVNQYRSFIKHLISITASQRLQYDPTATNSDYKSEAQTILAKGLLDYYNKEKKLERYLDTALEYAIAIFAEGFTSVTWDVSDGDMFGVNPETGAPIFNGDVSYKNYTPMDVIHDFTKQNAISDQWKMTRDYDNKYDLAMKFPELAERILNLPNKLEDKRQTILFPQTFDDMTDDVTVFNFYHEPTEALPNGRLCTVLSDDLWLFDGPMPYRDIPVYRLAADSLQGTSFGYTVAYDLLPIQDSYDILHSSIITNQSTFGIQNIIVKKGAGISVTEVQTGMNLVEADDVNDVKPLQLTSTPAEIFNYLGILEKMYENLTGINSVTRGQPEASLKSGTALALVQSQSIQFTQSLQKSYIQHAEDLGLATINLLKDFAKVPRIASITGQANKSYLREFSGDDLSLVNRTQIDIGNPLSRTTAGKVNLADALLEKGLIDNPQQYIQVVTTGQIEPATKGPQAQETLIVDENEKLADGVIVNALVTDRHDLHILEHAVVASSVEAREDPKIMEALNAHIQQHIDLYTGMSPVLAAMLHMPPPPPPPLPPGVLPPGQAGPPTDAAPALNPANPVEKKAGEAQPPKLPKNPVTGEVWSPANGGLPHVS